MTGTAITFGLSSGASDLILGLVAGALVVFALVVSLVIPRRRPDFPSRSMGAFFALTVLLVIGMLVAVEALGESHDFGAGHGGAAEAPTTPADTQASETGKTETQATGTETEGTGTGGGAEGDPAAGEQVFASAGCGSCHTLASAGTSGAVGPDLDQALPGKSSDYIRTQIVDPNSEVAEGFQAGIMPQNFGEQLSDADLANLVAYLAAEAGS